MRRSGLYSVAVSHVKRRRMAGRFARWRYGIRSWFSAQPRAGPGPNALCRSSNLFLFFHPVECVQGGACLVPNGARRAPGSERLVPLGVGTVAHRIRAAPVAVGLAPFDARRAPHGTRLRRSVVVARRRSVFALAHSSFALARAACLSSRYSFAMRQSASALARAASSSARELMLASPCMFQHCWNRHRIRRSSGSRGASGVAA